MSVPRSDELLLAFGHDVLVRYGTWIKRTLPEEEQALSLTRGSDARFRDRSGFLRTAESNVLRPHWITSESEYAYRGEASGENHLTRSDALDHGDWSMTAASVTANQAGDPEGGSTLDEIVEDGTTSEHTVTQTQTLTADATYALSAWYIANTRSWAFLHMRESGDAANFVRGWFNLSTGAVGTNTDGGTGSFSRAYIEDWTDAAPGLYRCILVGSIGNSATSINARVGMADADGSTTYAGDGSSSLYVGYAQLEDASDAASSYIATEASSVTRSADSLPVDWNHAPQAMTVYAKLEERGTRHLTNSNRYFEIGQTSNRLAVFTDAGSTDYRALLSTDGSNDFAPGLTSGAIGSVVELRLVLEADGTITLGASIDGGSESTTTPTSDLDLPDDWAMDRLTLNDQGQGGARGFADISHLVIAPGTRTLAECRAIEV